MVRTMRKFKREFPASGMQRIEDPLIMQARKRSGQRFEYDHAGSMRKIHVRSAVKKSLEDSYFGRGCLGKIGYTSGIIDENINLVKTLI
jgi:hypothetical protein